jgi:CheY-like chemotaxis protein
MNRFDDYLDQTGGGRVARDSGPAAPPRFAFSRIVLVDDNSADNLYHRLILEDCLPETEVVSYSGGQEALDGLTRSDAAAGPTDSDLVLVDLNMPAMTGWEFIDRYCAEIDLRDSRLAVLSTTENPVEMQRAYDHTEVCGFMSKPLSEAKLRDLVATTS